MITGLTENKIYVLPQYVVGRCGNTQCNSMGRMQFNRNAVQSSRKMKVETKLHYNGKVETEIKFNRKVERRQNCSPGEK